MIKEEIILSTAAAAAAPMVLLSIKKKNALAPLVLETQWEALTVQPHPRE